VSATLRPTPADEDEEVAVITGIAIVSVWVLDQDAAKEFYTTKLGCTLTNDLQLDNGMRWLTVRPQGSTNQELQLMDPSHSMLDEVTAQQVRSRRQGRAEPRSHGHHRLPGGPCGPGRARRRVHPASG
jgi:catechol 2,3-dioxygenase-like lactoylglutathione lyase family enzyme